ncbi:MAG TPA: S9 family peptidase [Firmicutes bacterium]|nr:S9 family peptidase [Candidatus Fermentithermobacillaceae bacterium]
MRRGWHPQRSYALFHAYNQYLVQEGYVVLSVNFRGGTGYGRDFREALYHKMGVDDVADVIAAADYLKALSYVDPEGVGVYGLSYGGYLTLHCLTQYPDVFRCGINIAGIWDEVQWTKWADKRYGKRAGLFKAFLGGEPEDSPELYRQASPKTFAANMKAPLLNVHGTADMNVDFQQMDSIIRDLVDLGKDFEVIYYPDEVHTFAKKKTWMDAMPKMKRFFDRHLKE